MTVAFADAFYYFALLDPSDPAHDRAKAFTAAHAGKYLTTDWVLVEVADGLARSADGRKAFSRLWREVFAADSITTVVRCEVPLLDVGVQLYDHRPDKGWSLTDCISFVVMDRNGVRDALTGDHHFTQAGSSPCWSDPQFVRGGADDDSPRNGQGRGGGSGTPPRPRTAG